MSIFFSETKEFSPQDIEGLFLSVKWESGKYPDKIVRGLKNSSVVISAWDEKKLVGLVRGLDDGETVGFLHYLLVDPEYQGQHLGKMLMDQVLGKWENLLYVKIMPSDPKIIGFYEKLGFILYDNYYAMEIKRL